MLCQSGTQRHDTQHTGGLFVNTGAETIVLDNRTAYFHPIFVSCKEGVKTVRGLN